MMSLPAAPSRFDLCQWLPENVRADFLAASRTRHYPRGSIIYSQSDIGDCMFRLLSGAVRLSVLHASGRELLFVIFEPCDCFGISSLIDGEGLPHTAEALEDVELQTLHVSAFQRLRSAHPAFDDALLRLTARHMRVVSGYFASAHLEDITARIASRLVAAVESFGTAVPGGIGLTIDLHQSEIALMVGGSRQTVNRVLQLFQRDRLVGIEHGRLIVYCVEELRARAGIEPAEPTRQL